jgi:hypothetical protein
MVAEGPDKHSARWLCTWPCGGCGTRLHAGSGSAVDTALPAHVATAASASARAPACTAGCPSAASATHAALGKHAPPSCCHAGLCCRSWRRRSDLVLFIGSLPIGFQPKTLSARRALLQHMRILAGRCQFSIVCWSIKHKQFLRAGRCCRTRASWRWTRPPPTWTAPPTRSSRRRCGRRCGARAPAASGNPRVYHHPPAVGQLPLPATACTTPARAVVGSVLSPPPALTLAP